MVRFKSGADLPKKKGMEQEGMLINVKKHLILAHFAMSTVKNSSQEWLSWHLTAFKTLTDDQ